MPSLRIALIGYGRMGRMVEQAALQRGHTIVCRIDLGDAAAFASEAFLTADVAIEFSHPASAADNIERCLEAGVPVVVGTTGWSSGLPRLRALCLEKGGAMIYSSNFSIGVSIFRSLSRFLARVMRRFPQYHPSLEETHHIHKLDHPSGTAITLAEELIEARGDISGWSETPGPGQLPVRAMREGEVPGIHTVIWESPADEITLTHSARGREGFAEGAVAAAEWLPGRKGCFTMTDYLADVAPELV